MRHVFRVLALLIAALFLALGIAPG